MSSTIVASRGQTLLPATGMANRRIASLNGVRGLLALVVTCVHALDCSAWRTFD